jgi:hypothetical protein
MPASGTRRSLDEQIIEFRRQRFIAMPIAGTMVWFVIGLTGAFFEPRAAVWTLYIGTGSIFYLGIFISRLTGENFFDKSKPKNTFDHLFMITVGMSLLVFAIAIPFGMVDYTSLPLSIGILSGMMWLPMSWLLHHWIGIAHGTVRTMLILLAWYLFPELRFVAIPMVIVTLYVATIAVLEYRWRSIQDHKSVIGKV